MMNDPVFEERRVSPERLTIDTSIDRRLRGRAITFNKISKVVVDPRIGRHRERILSTAVDRVLTSGAEVKALWNHDQSQVLGSRRAGTLVLSKGVNGLLMELEPPRWASRHVETVERGDVDGMSFAFQIPTPEGEEWDFRTSDGIPLRTVKDMIFREISIVTFPAYDDTSVVVSQRSIDAFLEQQPHGAPYNWRAKWHEMSQW